MCGNVGRMYGPDHADAGTGDGNRRPGCTYRNSFNPFEMSLGNVEGRGMIDVLVGFIVVAFIYLLGLVSGLFASAQIIAGKE